MPHPDYLFLYSLSASTRHAPIDPRFRVLTPRLVRKSNGLECSQEQSSRQSTIGRLESIGFVKWRRIGVL